MWGVLVGPKACHAAIIVHTKETKNSNEHIKPDVEEVFLIYNQKFVPWLLWLMMVVILFNTVFMSSVRIYFAIDELTMREPKDFPILFRLMLRWLFYCLLNCSYIFIFVKKLQSFFIKRQIYDIVIVISKDLTKGFLGILFLLGEEILNNLLGITLYSSLIRFHLFSFHCFENN